MIPKLKLSNPHKFIVSHLNINSLRNKFESIADVIQGTFDIFLLSETKIDVSLINSFASITIKYFGKIETGMGEESCFM